MHDADTHQLLDRGRNGGLRLSDLPGGIGNRHQGLALQQLVQPQGRRRGAPKRLDQGAIAGEELQDGARGGDGVAGGDDHAAQEEGEPGFPVPVFAHVLQPVVVGLVVLFEIQAEVQQRLAQHAALTQQKGDQQAAESAVAVEERVNRLELHMRKR